MDENESLGLRLPLENVDETASGNFATTSGDGVAEAENQKAVVDGLWLLDGRMVVAETIEDALALYEALFHTVPVKVERSTRGIDPGEKVAYNIAEPTFSQMP
jgi:hypothetical protein